MISNNIGFTDSKISLFFTRMHKVTDYIQIYKNRIKLMQFGHNSEKDIPYDGSLHRLDSASKRLPPNRIKVISKLPAQNPIESNHISPQFSSRTSVNNIPKKTTHHELLIKKMHSCDERTSKQQYQKNLLSLMQEQLQLAKKLWEDKMRQVLKQYSIELSKLKIKIENNNELLQRKDAQIERLKQGQKVSSPMNKRVPECNHEFVINRMIDIEGRVNFVVGEIGKMGMKIKQFQAKAEKIQKGLLRIMACKMSNLQIKIDKFAEASNTRIYRIEQQNIQKRKQYPSAPHSPSQPSLTQLKVNMQSIKYWVQSLKEEILTFRSKEFKYENSNITILQDKLTSLTFTVNQIDSNSLISQKSITPTKSIRRKQQYSHNDSITKPHDFSSSLFDDYEEQIYEQFDSMGEDQFFHPLEQSARKYLYQNKKTPDLKHSKTPSRMNDSFQNFTSEDEEEEYSASQIRLIQTLKYHKYPQPLLIQVDESGLVRVKSKGIYLLDAEQKCFKLSNLELNRLRHKRIIEW